MSLSPDDLVAFAAKMRALGVKSLRLGDFACEWGLALGPATLFEPDPVVPPDVQAARDREAYERDLYYSAG